jgi:hypothetical protein
MTVVWLLVVPPVSAADPTTEFRSRLGFTLTLPPNWWPLAADIVSEKSEGAEEHRELAELDPETLRVALGRIRSGEYEYCFRQSFSDGFAENLTIRRRELRIVDDPEQFREQCKSVPESFGRAYGRPVTVSACELRTVAGRPASYLELEGAVEGTRVLQYQVRESSGTAIALTATLRENQLPETRSEFESIVRSADFGTSP